MPSTPLPSCLFPGCPVRVSKGYCDVHKKQRTTEYEQSRKGHNQAYWSSQWKRARELALTRDEYICIPCRDEGVITPATQVHHIEKFDKHRWQTDPKFTDLDNLMSICASHHSRIDGGWGRSKQKLGQESKPAPGSTEDFEARFGK